MVSISVISGTYSIEVLKFEYQ
eukprot:SAG31_NODE_2881_length_4958_cov_3.159086_5_plen_21_part_01